MCVVKKFILYTYTEEWCQSTGDNISIIGFSVYLFIYNKSLYSIHLGHPKGSKVSAPAKAEAQKAAPTIEVPALSLDELKEMTDNFGSKALIGEGSYGRVYYANLNNGKNVAVKKLDVSSEPDSNIEFLTQVC